MKSILYLTLKKPQFQVTSIGEKKTEYRRHSAWIKSRLENRNYDVVKFVNGYGSDKPYFIVQFLGYQIETKSHTIKYSNGLTVNVTKGDYSITLGEIVEKGNI